MSFDDFKLSTTAIANMYRSVIIEHLPEGSLGPQEEGINNRLKFLGKNQKNVTVIVNTPDHVYLEEGDLQFLSKILLACRLNLGDIALINISGKPTSGDVIHQELSPRQMILLGVEPAEIHLPFNFPAFKNQAHGSCTYLHAPAIRKLNQQNEEAKSLKSKLWLSLKAMFNV